MALASLTASPIADGPAVSPTDGSRPFDEYLLEVYRQAGENARMYANSRFSNLGAFLTYVSLLTAALAVLFTALEGSTGPLIPAACMALGVMGLLVSVLFYALEVRHHNWWEFYEFSGVRRLEGLMGHSQYPDAEGSTTDRTWIPPGLFGISATNATYGIYKASIGFFGLAIVIATALLVMR
jgi:hypothetical protein